MRPFNYYEPVTLKDAVALLQQHSERVSLLAGGTDLLVEIKEHIRSPEHIINLKKIPGLDYVMYDETAGLRFGALTTIRSLEISPVVSKKYPGLAQALREIASVQIRNRATVGGNICRSSPSADTLPPLIADGARVTIFGPHGERQLLLEDFFTGPGKNQLIAGEILVEISVPAPPPHTGQVYMKHGRRKAMELATVGVAVTLTLNADICEAVRIVLGAVAATPIRARKAEEMIRGKPITPESFPAVAATAMLEARAIDDVRSSAAYRKEIVRVLTGRALEKALVIAKSDMS
jgi:aerobic carbon-monoxide dehydrogenase medium subunit